MGLPVIMDLDSRLIMFYPSDFTPLGTIIRRRSMTDLNPNWTPPGKPGLRYQALYRGVYEYLREPPVMARVPDAVRYLRQLRKCYHPSNALQRDRIAWTLAWLDAVAVPDDSDDETVIGDGDN